MQMLRGPAGGWSDSGVLGCRDRLGNRIAKVYPQLQGKCAREGSGAAGAAVPGWGRIAYKREHLKWRVSQAEIKSSGSD